MSVKAKVSGFGVAGFPLPAEQYLEPTLDLNKLLVNRTAATNALGAVTVSAYDAANHLAESGGTVYSSRYGYDTEGHRTALSTTRNGSVWDATAWTFDAETGHCTAKTYADNTANAYTYTADGKPLRTSCASGRWRENACNVRRELASVEYSDGEVCTFSYDEFSHEVASSNAVAAAQFVRNCYGQVTNETATVGSESRTVESLRGPQSLHFALSENPLRVCN